MTGVEGGDQFFFGKNDSYRVTAVDCIHSIPCVGFMVDERRKKLKEEYAPCHSSQPQMTPKEQEEKIRCANFG